MRAEETAVTTVEASPSFERLLVHTVGMTVFFAFAGGPVRIPQHLAPTQLPPRRVKESIGAGIRFELVAAAITHVVVPLGSRLLRERSRHHPRPPRWRPILLRLRFILPRLAVAFPAFE